MTRWNPIEPAEVSRVIESLERIAAQLETAENDDDTVLVKHGMESHAAGIRTAIQIVRADLLHENPWAEENETVAS